MPARVAERASENWSTSNPNRKASKPGKEVEGEHRQELNVHASSAMPLPSPPPAPQAPGQNLSRYQ